jgi:Outer membrane protein and related peptidoglycan-associated (lipo)proteins
MLATMALASLNGCAVFDDRTTMANEPSQRTFQVFFDHDRSTLSERAAEILQLAADSAKQSNAAGIYLTVPAGASAYSHALSERRAQAIRAELVKDGVAAEAITDLAIDTAGELAPMADGVREPRNRRTEIILH